MKKLVSSLFIVVFVIFIVLAPYKTRASVNLQQNQPIEYQTKQVLNQIESSALIVKSTLSVSCSHLLEIIPYEEHEPIVYENILSVEDYFNMFPEAVRDTFYNMGWKWTKTDYDIGPVFGYPQILGITVWADRQIYINYQNSANSSILHEMGHAFEYSSYVKGANSKEFLELYNKNWQSWHNKYGMHINNYNTPEEGYAQCWEIYILKPECLDEETRAFIESEIYNIGG